MEDLEPRQVILMHLFKIIEDNATDEQILSMIKAFEEDDEEEVIVAEPSTAVH